MNRDAAKKLYGELVGAYPGKFITKENDDSFVDFLESCHEDTAHLAIDRLIEQNLREVPSKGLLKRTIIQVQTEMRSDQVIPEEECEKCLGVRFLKNAKQSALIPCDECSAHVWQRWSEGHYTLTHRCSVCEDAVHNPEGRTVEHTPALGPNQQTGDPVEPDRATMWREHLRPGHDPTTPERCGVCRGDVTLEPEPEPEPLITPTPKPEPEPEDEIVVPEPPVDAYVHYEEEEGPIDDSDQYEDYDF